MGFGICTSPEHAPAAKSAGWDYIEFSAQHILRGFEDDPAWSIGSQVGTCHLATPCANQLVPAAMKVVGPDADLAALEIYIDRLCRRASTLNCRTLVFGSGGARRVPNGFSREVAFDQTVAFLKLAGSIASREKVMIVIEPLNQSECNVINSVLEAMTYVHAVNMDSIKCLVDTYHLWLESEPLTHVRAAGRAIRHVHVADRVGRVAPGLSGQSDYRAVFRILKEIGYEGLISVEASNFDFVKRGPEVLDYLKKQWVRA